MSASSLVPHRGIFTPTVRGACGRTGSCFGDELHSRNEWTAPLMGPACCCPAIFRRTHKSHACRLPAFAKSHDSIIADATSLRCARPMISLSCGWRTQAERVEPESDIRSSLQKGSRGRHAATDFAALAQSMAADGALLFPKRTAHTVEGAASTCRRCRDAETPFAVHVACTTCESRACQTRQPESDGRSRARAQHGT